MRRTELGRVMGPQAAFNDPQQMTPAEIDPGKMPDSTVVIHMISPQKRLN